jgi:hypothetical protein
MLHECYNISNTMKTLNTTEIAVPIIFRGDSFFIALSTYKEHVSNNGSKIIEPIYSASKLGISRRVLSHWRSIGLLDVLEGKLSLVDVFWIKIMQDLRSFGVSLPKLKEAKKFLFEDINGVTLIEFYLTLALTQKKKDFFVVVTSSGVASIATTSELETSEVFGLLDEDYIKINIRRLLGEILESYNISPLVENRIALQKGEDSVLSAIRSGDFQEVTVSMGDGIITRITKTESSPNPDAIKILRDSFKRGVYGKVEVLLKDGKVVHVNNKESEKIE